jgi:hypothetical protein
VTGSLQDVEFFRPVIATYDHHSVWLTNAKLGSDEPLDRMYQYISNYGWADRGPMPSQLKKVFFNGILFLDSDHNSGDIVGIEHLLRCENPIN